MMIDYIKTPDHGHNKKRPTVDIVMIDSRSPQHPEWVKQAKTSALNQTYPGVGLLVFNNTAKINTIGTCWNSCVHKSKADFVFFLGDDDIISPVMITVLVDSFYMAQRQLHATNPKLKMVMVSSGITLINDQTQIIGHSPILTTGLIDRQWLLTHKFSETLKKGVDDEWLGRSRAAGAKDALANDFFGYYYRQHPGQVSGQATITNAPTMQKV
jgi:hypothetical protein